MPKSFTDAEKAYIKERLMAETEQCLALYGVRKTTVDELVHRAGIPKGTFYLFYKSKEALIFDVILKLNTDIQRKLIQQISAMREVPNAQQLTDILFALYQSLDDSFLLKLIENKEMQFLLQKAPPEFQTLNALDDERMVKRLLSLFPDMDTQRSALLSAALRGTFMMLIYKEEIKADNFDDMLYLVLRGIILQMFGA